ncbi:predicted protein [Naegleria gruberi]|uniref:Predicted protein n=1 Tax=Naegleria gruberi TaxID=5762 RepID=D2W3L0_NAEGR|nr:uncharacterized protein NAEGRDRAFT_75980 [Naegleria gruberi]EFC36351.1 predicted protein [Naegleria gruberi]|eukprot:XP_002669095.1 predicted protein [Naegleria gruberi strain NEG-M]
MFFRGVKQYCALQKSLHVTRNLQVMIESAGKDREENLERYWTGMAMERASKALITKQLRNLLCGLFVNASSIYFSDVKLSVDFISAMFCDVKKPTKKKKVENDDDEELSFKHRSVFEVIEKLSFLSCEFEEGVMEWITKKFKAIDTLVFKRCKLKYFPSSCYLPVAFLSQPLNAKKCKFYDSMRFLVVENFETFVSVNLERYKTEEEKQFIEKYINLTPELLSSGTSINDGEQTAYFHYPPPEKINETLSLIPEHVILICFQAEKTSIFASTILRRIHWRDSAKDLKLFRMVDSSFSLTPILGFDLTNGKLENKKTTAEIMDIFYMGFNFWNCSKSDHIQYLVVIILHYYEDDELIKFLRFKGLNVDMEYFEEPDDKYYEFSRIGVIFAILEISKRMNVLTDSLKKYFEKNSANFAQSVRNNFVNMNSWTLSNYSEDQIEFIQYLVEKKILSDSYTKQINEYKSKDTTLEPALKKRKN